MKRFLGFVKKEFLHIFRDYRTLIILFGIPAAQILIFGYAVSTDIKNAGVAFLDLSKDEVTQKLSDKICSSEFFHRTDNILNYSDIDKVFKKGKTKIVIVFEKNFGSSLISEGKASMSIIADGSEPNTATLVTNYIMAIVADFNREFTGRFARPFHVCPGSYNPHPHSYQCSDDIGHHNEGKRVRYHGGTSGFAPETDSDHYGESNALLYFVIYKCDPYTVAFMAGFWSSGQRKYYSSSCRKYALYTFESFDWNSYINSLENYAAGDFYLSGRDDVADNPSFRFYLPHRKYAGYIQIYCCYPASQIFHYYY